MMINAYCFQGCQGVTNPRQFHLSCNGQIQLKKRYYVSTRLYEADEIEKGKHRTEVPGISINSKWIG